MITPTGHYTRRGRAARLAAAWAFILVAGLGLSACGSVSAPSPTVPASPAGVITNGAANSAAGDISAAPGTSVKFGIGNPAPDFSLKDVSGKPVQLSALRGKAVLLNYWAVY